MFEATVTDGVLRVRREGTRWLSTGWNGGVSVADAAYNVSVPDGWEETALDGYIRERRRAAGFEEEGPALLTGLALEHARRARLGPVEVYATAGLSNPAALPMESGDEASDEPTITDGKRSDEPTDGPPEPGTVNLLVGTKRALPAGALANLVAVAAEAKAATLQAETGFPGTTSDAVAAGCDPAGDPATFTGSATAVGTAARVCVRDAVQASLDSRYPEQGFPESVTAAEHGVDPAESATVSTVTESHSSGAPGGTDQ